MDKLTGLDQEPSNRGLLHPHLCHHLGDWGVCHPLPRTSPSYLWRADGVQPALYPGRGSADHFSYHPEPDLGRLVRIGCAVCTVDPLALWHPVVCAGTARHPCSWLAYEPGGRRRSQI